MVKFNWKINGKNIPESQVSGAIVAAFHDDIKNAAEKMVKDKLSRATCPEHGKTPQNIRIEGSFPKAQVLADYCCEKLEEQVQNILR